MSTRILRPTPLLSLELQAPIIHRSNDSDYGEDDDEPVTKRWYHYTPVACMLSYIILEYSSNFILKDIFALPLVIVAIALTPHPSILRVLINYHLRALESPLSFGVHLIALYTLTLGIFASLFVCIMLDPGTVPSSSNVRHNLGDVDGDVDLTEALMLSDGDNELPGSFCFKCRAPKPERAHHCSTCGRCILKMGESFVSLELGHPGSHPIRL